MISYNQLQSKDNHLSTNKKPNNYQLRYLSIAIAKSYAKWSYQAIVEDGKYMPYHQDYRHWQNYQLYLTYNYSPIQQYSAYARLGYLLAANEISVRWTQVYGICGCWQWSCRLRARLLYEYTHRLGELVRHFALGEVTYVRPNNHLVQLKGFYNQQKVDKNGLWRSIKWLPHEFKLLFSYTIPFGVPVGIKKSAGGALGVLNCEGNALANVRVSCNGNTTLTDARGQFFFPRLTPGSYCLWLEDEVENFVSEQELPMNFSVPQGKMAKIEVKMMRMCKIVGQINLYGFANSEQSTALYQQGLTTDSNAPLRYQKTGPWRYALIKLIAENSSHVLYASADAEGKFSFTQMRPGKWRMTVAPHGLPSHHFLEKKEYEIEINSGEELSVEVRILPQMRQLKMIDAGDVSAI